MTGGKFVQNTSQTDKVKEKHFTQQSRRSRTSMMLPHISGNHIYKSHTSKYVQKVVRVVQQPIVAKPTKKSITLRSQHRRRRERQKRRQGRRKRRKQEESEKEEEEEETEEESEGEEEEESEGEEEEEESEGEEEEEESEGEEEEEESEGEEEEEESEGEEEEEESEGEEEEEESEGEEEEEEESEGEEEEETEASSSVSSSPSEEEETEGEEKEETKEESSSSLSTSSPSEEEETEEESEGEEEEGSEEEEEDEENEEDDDDDEEEEEDDEQEEKTKKRDPRVGGLDRWTKESVAALKIQAADFLQNHTDYMGHTALNFITRDQTPTYFKKIYTEKEGIMTKELKDGYGSPQNPINHRLRGLFFSAIVNFSTGEPFPNSRYGPRRLKLPVKHLFKPNKHLYFSDFYDMKSSYNKKRRHNITLVLCEPGSKPDKFCERALPQLNIKNNLFLYISHTGKRVYVTKGAYVEIFYTEDMDISSMKQYFENVEWPGWGRQLYPQKNTRCKYCNLWKVCVV